MRNNVLERYSGSASPAVLPESGLGLRRRAVRRLHGLEVVRVRLHRRRRRRRADLALRRPAAFFAPIRLHLFVGGGEVGALLLGYVLLPLHLGRSVRLLIGASIPVVGPAAPRRRVDRRTTAPRCAFQLKFLLGVPLVYTGDCALFERQNWSRRARESPDVWRPAIVWTTLARVGESDIVRH